jgi:putative membrane protein
MITHALRQFVALVIFVFTPATALAAEAPAPAEVLAKLHQSNLKEIEMGKLAQERGQSKEVKAFGKTLVKDHTAADKKVQALARQEKVELPEAPPAMDHSDLGSGSAFDMKFSQAMVEDHKKDIDEVKTARETTTNARLKALLTELLPTLERHRETAERLANGKVRQTAAPAPSPGQR